MRCAPIRSLAVTVHSAAGSLAAPSNITTDNSGGDISSWQQGLQAPANALLRILPETGITTLSDAVLLGKPSDSGSWEEILQINDDLNGGDDIVMNAAYGWARMIGPVGIYKYLRVVGTINTGNIDVIVEPVEFSEAAG